LVSTKAGKLAGIREVDAKQTNPNFINQLYLYRKGLFSAYDFQVAEGKEPKNEFEERVLMTFNNIINSYNGNDNVLLISHRSPITTILTYIAKKFYDYPEGFLGYVPLDLGYFSIIERKNNCFKIICVNESIDNICNYI
jgi:broad specificity phosphatase PhoE